MQNVISETTTNWALKQATENSRRVQKQHISSEHSFCIMLMFGSEFDTSTWVHEATNVWDVNSTVWLYMPFMAAVFPGLNKPFLSDNALCQMLKMESLNASRKIRAITSF